MVEGSEHPVQRCSDAILEKLNLVTFILLFIQLFYDLNIYTNLIQEPLHQFYLLETLRSE